MMYSVTARSRASTAKVVAMWSCSTVGLVISNMASNTRSLSWFAPMLVNHSLALISRFFKLMVLVYHTWAQSQALCVDDSLVIFNSHRSCEPSHDRVRLSVVRLALTGHVAFNLLDRIAHTPPMHRPNDLLKSKGKRFVEMKVEPTLF